MSRQVVNGYWYLLSNVGDALTPWLIRRTGQQPVYAVLESPRRKVVGAGSILNHANETCDVWGAGIARSTDPVEPRATLHAVRGPLSRARAHACGADMDHVALGDPGLLVPKFYAPPRTPPRYPIGLLPHLVDQERVFNAYAGDDDVGLIDVLAPVEEVVDAILRCEAIVSSSLHGLVLACAYNVPARWVVFSDGVLGDGTKFHDFFLSVGLPTDEAIDLRDRQPLAAELAALVSKEHVQEPGVCDLEALWRVCPFSC